MPIYVLDKPLGLTSHDAVAAARRALGTRRVGHAGTLDPLAGGVLVLLSEEDTRLSPFLSESRKRYLAWVSFGATTPTLDAEGPLLERADASAVSAERVQAALAGFAELREQVPPSYSAIKRAGVRSYRRARRGLAEELPSRPVRYYGLTLHAFASRRQLPAAVARGADGEWQPAAGGRPVALPEPLADLPTALLSLEVAAGTYVRAFARDLGAALGLPAFLAGLLRTRAGRLGLEQAAPLAELGRAAPLSPLQALPFEQVRLDAAEARRVRQGQRLPLTFEGRAALVDPAGRLAAVAEASEGRMKLLRVWPE